MSTDNIRQKIAKLLSTAESLGDAPAADAYRDRAFDLAARYGIDTGSLHDSDADDMITREYKFAGAYTDMQSVMLNRIALSLHCFAVAHQVYNSTRTGGMSVFGRRKHIDRVDMLFSILNPIMIAGAKRVPSAPAYSSVSTVTRRRSYMRGFVADISARLQGMESKYADAYAAGDTSGALVLVDDAKQARGLAEETYSGLRQKRSKFRVDRGSFQQGQQDAANTDVGQTRVGGNLAIES